MKLHWSESMGKACLERHVSYFLNMYILHFTLGYWPDWKYRKFPKACRFAFEVELSG